MRGSARELFGVLTVVAGCFSTPQRPEGLAIDASGGIDSGVDLPMLTVTPGPTLAIGTNDYTMTFQSGGWALPQSLVMNAAPAVERLSFTQPFGEKAIGVTLWPTYTVNAGSLATNGSATRTVVSAGPAKAVVDVGWTGPEHCAGSGELLNNLSRFTFYPDGRIVRHDEVHTKNTCDNNLGTLDAFVWSPDMSAFYEVNGTKVSFSVPPQTASYVSLGRATQGNACLQDATSAFGFTWHPKPDPAEWEMVEIQLIPDTFAAALFWAENVDTVPGHTYDADTTLLIRGRGTRCGDLASKLVALQAPPPLGGAVYRESDGAYVLAGLGTATAQGDLPSGFVLELDSPSAVTIERTSAVASRSRILVPGVDYIEQRDGTFLTWFVIDALFTGEQLVLSQ